MQSSSLIVPDVLTGEPLIRLSHVSKSYPGVTALSDLTLDIRPGEVIGLVGENGAGKSTLMKILGGVISPDRGAIEIGGTKHASLTVKESMAAGIAFVHQELNLFGNLDVAANVFIGREPRKFGILQLIDTAKLHAMVQPYLDRLGATFPVTALVSDLSLAEQQLVEITKALSLNSRLLILDEPTSSLPLAETRKLLDVIAALKEHGIAVVFISHRLHEVVQAADRVAVLRDGRLVGQLREDAITHDAMVKLMVGRELTLRYSAPAVPRGSIALSLRGVRTPAKPTADVDLDIYRGEILGIAGLVGAGRTELARVIFGIDRPLEGTMLLDGAQVALRSSRDAVAAGIFLVPEDRKAMGLVLDLPISQNITLPDLEAYAKSFIVSGKAEETQAERSRTDLDIRAPNMEVRAGLLSGGNQQKVVLAKWLAMTAKIIVLDEPTRGVDIGAKSEIYRLMRYLADQGVAVLMISSDMEEVIGVSDRIAVMHEGRISGELPRHSFSEENVLALAVGRSLQPDGETQAAQLNRR
ncbi:sugar ABC transporter ATP-binding protein [Aestuariivirga sp.]|uniref:sugar ABC transporter ATP-binding protein n=1 Tax=Aestuariivirga sp. TaxID=2650926 RepID=UPI003BACC8F6